LENRRASTITIICSARINGKTIIGCDTLISTATKKSSKVSKIYRFGGFFIGAAGTATIFHVLNDFHKANKQKAAPRNAEAAYKFTRPIFREYAERLKELLTFSKADEDGCSLLIATKNAIFVCDEYSVESFTDFAAIGSGEPYALGAFEASYPDELCIKKALEASCKYEKSCGRPTIIEVL
jgi:ATP-dependent protease HslVU (ClpYQ) peptidase subunit